MFDYDCSRFYRKKFYFESCQHMICRRQFLRFFNFKAYAANCRMMQFSPALKSKNIATKSFCCENKDLNFKHIGSWWDAELLGVSSGSNMFAKIKKRSVCCTRKGQGRNDNPDLSITIGGLMTVVHSEGTIYCLGRLD